MSCEKYSAWITDAALGELRAEREPELLAHAMECEVCREALTHATKVRDFVERGVESLVEGEPSPQFVTHLRRRIARGPRPVEFAWARWALVAPGALALALLLILVIGRMPGQNGSGPTASSLKPRPWSQGVAAAPDANRLNARAAVSGRASERLPHAHKATAGLPNIIVPEGQLFAAARLSEAINAGRVDGAQLVVAQRDADKPLEVNPIEITPLDPPPTPDDEEKPAAPTEF
jgi:anti-sigma factor RsiW